MANDYNAGMVGVLAKMYGKYGGNPIPNFTAIEEVGQEYEVEAAIVAAGIGFINLRVTLMNKTAWPPRASDKLSAKYFVDITESLNAGITVNDIRVATSTPGAKVSKLMPWDEDNNIYYVEIDLTGTNIFPGGINDYKRDVYFIIEAPYGEGNWDNSNDFSFEGLEGTGMEGISTQYVPMYDNGVRIYGLEPGGSPVPTPTPTPTPDPDDLIILGDLNDDGQVNSIDSTLMRRYILEILTFSDSESKEIFITKGDINNDGNINTVDYTLLNRFVLEVPISYPIGEMVER